jgi:hypothetical protein
MKRMLTICFASLGLLLSSCSSLVNTLIPDQPVDNPFGLNDRLLILTMPRPDDPFAPLESATYSGGLSNDLVNIASSVFGPTRPTGLEEQLGIASNLTVSSAFANNSPDPQTVFPETLTLSKSSLSFKVVDGPQGAEFGDVFTSPSDLTFTLTKKTCETNVSRTLCTYVLNKETPLLQIQVLGENFNTLYDFITGGGQPNTISGSLSLELNGDSFPPLDSELRVILKTSGGKVKF